MFDNQKLFFIFLFLRIKNKVFKKNISYLFSVLFTCFLMMILTDNYTNI